ncbi:MAG: hypothetical protein UX80_C0034G0002 [Candidatus Amesbacteria bacterium GW2011_GWA2_47_11b]|uniref:Uncharacterized protein n=1 Tax=Candidatus Amesbacteria bacterium GW2011_GWA2_47_11b TaxID=1618358 RepID=A0A0G1TQY4_9BACT|nr:MAG: hypothetical protein UX80_C0034G0002 [Candidatus Amesbacteria bacterium GW2011_GWA2_47_11b]
MAKAPFLIDPQLNQALGNLAWVLTSEFRPLSSQEIKAISNVVYESSMLAKIGVADPSEIKQTTEEFLKKSGKAEKEG